MEAEWAGEGYSRRPGVGKVSWSIGALPGGVRSCEEAGDITYPICAVEVLGGMGEDVEAQEGAGTLVSRSSRLLEETEGVIGS